MPLAGPPPQTSTWKCRARWPCVPEQFWSPPLPRPFSTPSQEWVIHFSFQKYFLIFYVGFGSFSNNFIFQNLVSNVFYCYFFSLKYRYKFGLKIRRNYESLKKDPVVQSSRSFFGVVWFLLGPVFSCPHSEWFTRPRLIRLHLSIRREHLTRSMHHSVFTLTQLWSFNACSSFLAAQKESKYLITNMQVQSKYKCFVPS